MGVTINLFDWAELKINRTQKYVKGRRKHVHKIFEGEQWRCRNTIHRTRVFPGFRFKCREVFCFGFFSAKWARMRYWVTCGQLKPACFISPPLAIARGLARMPN